MAEDKDAPDAADDEAADAPDETELEAALREELIEEAAAPEVVVVELDAAPVAELDDPVAVLEAEEAQVAAVGRVVTPAPPHSC